MKHSKLSAWQQRKTWHYALLGSLAFKQHCPIYGYLQKQLGRAYTDIDFAGYGTQASKMASFMVALGYHEDPEINLYFAGQRMVFNNNGTGIHIDIFFDKLNFCHEVRWTSFSRRTIRRSACGAAPREDADRKNQ